MDFFFIPHWKKLWTKQTTLKNFQNSEESLIYEKENAEFKEK